MSNFELRLNSLFKQKVEIQKIEEINEKDKKKWRELGEKIRSKSQQLSELKKKLFEAI